MTLQPMVIRKRRQRPTDQEMQHYSAAHRIHLYIIDSNSAERGDST